MTWKLINELDEESLRRLLDELPAWVKVGVLGGGPLQNLSRRPGAGLLHHVWR